MKTKSGIVKAAHAEFDRRWSREVRNRKICITCSKGCSACCSEPLMVNQSEAKVIMASVPDIERQGVNERTEEWVDKAEASGLLNVEFPHVLDYMRAGLVCPLLKNGVCLVYENRPLGCRAHNATKDPALCGSLETRLDQVYVSSNELNTFAGMALMGASPKSDHLGVYLGRWLLSRRIISAEAREVPWQFAGLTPEGVMSFKIKKAVA